MVGYDLALASARYCRLLRASGIPIRKTIDLMIATFCMMNGFRLLHSDRDYAPIAEYLGVRTL